MPLITYDSLKKQLNDANELSLPSSAETQGEQVTGTFTGDVTLEVPQLPKIEFPLDDLTFENTLTGKPEDLNKLLSLKDGNGGKTNGYIGSQVVINSDRILFNSRKDFMMLFGEAGVAISSKGNVNIDAGDGITIFGEDGLFLGVPGKGKSLDEGGGNQKAPRTKAEPTLDRDYDPLVLGTKLANILEDLIIAVKNAVIVAPMGNAYLREDSQYDLACLQARIPEMLSTYAFLDGISHNPTLPPPTPPKTVTVPPTTLRGQVVGSFQGTTLTEGNGNYAPISNPLANDPNYYNGIDTLDNKINPATELNAGQTGG
jgi:hypothetical protein